MARFVLTLTCALITWLNLALTSRAQQTDFDFVVSGARVVDGTGAPWFVGDIGITGDRIAAIGEIAIEKTFRGKYPLTICRLTERGREVLDNYRKVIKAAL